MRFGMGHDAWTSGEDGMGRGAGRGHHRSHGGGGGGPRGRRVFDGGELKLVLLKLIGDTPRHGYDLIRELEALTGGGYVPSPGVIYPTLTLLDEMGLIEEQVSEGAKKRFAVTEAGRAQIAEQESVIDGLFARIAEMSAHRERTDSAPVRRAMGNLKAVLMHRLGRADLSIEDQHAVAALIDEAAQKIERLA
ncbi:PadR family transcriptional regulator [Sphingomonas sp. Leaf17]|uniref:PadR family transcriptional regulator n=1 Tax=Sphingomonas sp. Leaf17 TaxID=1735683 RepID=UPI000701AD86|nr:PadR family transcriptional regulator [Sphingomonas sp. Leaf17]KQM65045.1 PadR family transcriptional regulator [Sphingomonas sp. Leaf17]